MGFSFVTLAEAFYYGFLSLFNLLTGSSSDQNVTRRINRRVGDWSDAKKEEEGKG